MLLYLNSTPLFHSSCRLWSVLFSAFPMPDIRLAAYPHSILLAWCLPVQAYALHRHKRIIWLSYLRKYGVRVLGFFVGDMVRAVVLVLLGIFDDFRKVFHAVFQFHNALFGGLSRFGFYSNFMLQIGERTSFIIALCGDFQILDCCPLLQSGTVLEFLVRGVNEPACRVVFFRNNCLSFPFLFDAFPDTFLCVFFP